MYMFTRYACDLDRGFLIQSRGKILHDLVAIMDNKAKNILSLSLEKNIVFS